jgi:phage terminase large subunit GpA-like protein
LLPGLGVGLPVCVVAHGLDELTCRQRVEHERAVGQPAGLVPVGAEVIVEFRELMRRKELAEDELELQRRRGEGVRERLVPDLGRDDVLVDRLDGELGLHDRVEGELVVGARNRRAVLPDRLVLDLVADRHRAVFVDDNAAIGDRWQLSDELRDQLERVAVDHLCARGPHLTNDRNDRVVVDEPVEGCRVL